MAKEELEEQDIRLNKLCFDYYEKDKRIEELKQENEEMKKGLGCETCQIHLEYMRLNDNINELEKENEQLKQQIEKMKCCQNCKNLISLAYGEFSCDLYGECKHCSKWELKENE